MNKLRSLAVGGALVFSTLITPVATSVASATPVTPQNPSHVVFVQTNNPLGNQIAVYDRDDNGNLTNKHLYDTGGKGGAIGGAVVDKLASQGSLAYDPTHHLLVAVNAGSGNITSFQVDGDKLIHRQISSMGAGSLPVSVAMQGTLVYILDASGHGSVMGFRIHSPWLVPMTGSRRTLNLTPNVQPAFLNTPGQVGFAPDGHHLIVTTKNNGSQIDVFYINHDGTLAPTPAHTTAATPVPFGFTYDNYGHLIVGEAGASSVSTYYLSDKNHLTHVASLTDSQAALCWIAKVGNWYYVSNAGSANLSGYSIDSHGHPSLLTTTGIVASTDPGPTDLSVTSDGKFLYVDTGANGIVDGFKINIDGTLTAVGTVGGLGAMQIQGIVSL